MKAGRTIHITAGAVSADATLNDSRSAWAIWDALPLDARAETWGDEVYFPIGLTLGAESPQAVVEPGDIAYWPPGRAFCIFFGPTPASRGGEIRPSSPVNVVGRVSGDPKIFGTVRAGTRVRLERSGKEGVPR